MYVNDLLSSGRIPDLFTKEEYDGIFTSLRTAAQVEGIPDNRDSMMNFFISRVRCNLHLVLCFSPVGDLFRQRARKFPGIFLPLLHNVLFAPPSPESAVRVKNLQSTLR